MTFTAWKHGESEIGWQTMPREQTRRYVDGAFKLDIRQAVLQWPAEVFERDLVQIKVGAHAETVRLTRMSQQFGGAQMFFECGSCTRRVCILYRLGGTWACQRCHKLTHWSQAITARQRRIRRILRLLERIGQAPGGSIVGGLPPKPKWMRWRTFERHALDVARRRGQHFRSPLSATASVRLARMLK